jgi:hypothetical protein
MGRAVRSLHQGALLLLTIHLMACAPVAKDSSNSDNGTVQGPTSEVYKPVALQWEDQNKNGILWSAYVYQIIGTDLAPDLIPGSEDIQNFCPNYSALNNSQKVNFWAYLISVIARYASDFNPVSSVIDLSKGIDSVTGAPTFAQGLLHLAYADSKTYDFCAFNWQSDQDLSLTDIARTIFDPVKNLDCGLKILATTIDSTKKIASTSSYWNILKLGSPGNKVAEIEKQTSALPFCAKNP